MAESEAKDLPEKEIGNHGLKKKILRKGNSWQTPFPGDEVHGMCVYIYVSSSVFFFFSCRLHFL